MNAYLNRLPLAVAQTLAIHKIQLHHKLLARGGYLYSCKSIKNNSSKVLIQGQLVHEH